MELFPAPFMPSRPKHSPRGTPSDVLFTATCAPKLDGYTFDTASIWKHGGVVLISEALAVNREGQDDYEASRRGTDHERIHSPTERDNIHDGQTSSYRPSERLVEV